ncbi:hypothetical protein [Pseudomonas syringae]|uniref:hypothetical protein n=1 Tax=Pseudomonas syringae TaxID=317 RepID=UPI0012FD62B9|nr:hypothetical protein [Pseudomonas syringae]
MNATHGITVQFYEFAVSFTSPAITSSFSIPMLAKIEGGATMPSAIPRGAHTGGYADEALDPRFWMPDLPLH